MLRRTSDERSQKPPMDFDLMFTQALARELGARGIAVKTNA
jgi:hypothetical protein